MELQFKLWKILNKYTSIAVKEIASFIFWQVELSLVIPFVSFKFFFTPKQLFLLIKNINLLFVIMTKSITCQGFCGQLWFILPLWLIWWTWMPKLFLN